VNLKDQNYRQAFVRDVAIINAHTIKTGIAPAQIEYIDISSVGTGEFTEIPRLIPFVDAPSRARRIVKPGDTILSTVRPNRRSFLFLASPKSNTVASTGFAVLTPTVDVDARYLYYWVTRQEFTDYLSLHAKGAAYPAVSPEDIGGGEIMLPSLPMQCYIAGILSAYDELIENNQRRIKILEEMARSLYREWFVNFRFPGHEKIPLAKSSFGDIPKGWEVKKIGDIAEVMRRNIPKGELEAPKPYVGLEHIPRRSLALDSWEITNEIGSNKLEFKKGEVLFGKIRPYFHKVSVAPFDGLCSADTIVIRSRFPEHYAIIVASVSSDAFVAEASATANGAKMPRANWEVLEKFLVMIPKDNVAEKFSKLFGDIIAQQQLLVSQINNLRQTRDLLLPRLMSGQIELKDIEMEKSV
jgi:type I restriction enzyme S subunit